MMPDRYTFNARLQPVLITVLPAIILAFIVLPALWQVMGAICAIGISTGLLFLLGQCGRDFGKKKEPVLFDAIGGKPTTRLLRHADTTVSPATKKRYHDFINANVLGPNLPTLQEEEANPADADKIYDSAVDWLKGQTRDKKAHDLLFAENMSYGFRRNLWGMKPAGIILSLVSGVLLVALFFKLTGVAIEPSLALSASLGSVYI